MRIYKMGSDYGIDINLFANTVEKQNTDFRNRLQTMESDRRLDSQKSIYQMPSLDNYSFANSILSIIYICIVLVLAYKLYGSAKYSTLIKVLILASVAVYPFIISSIELTLYDNILFYYSLVTGNVYKKTEL
jgi:hypothetical protein